MPHPPSELPPDLAWQLLAAVGEAVAIKDEQLCYVWVNEAFCTLFNLDRSQILGRTDDEVFLEGPRVPDPDAEQAVLISGASSESYETIFLASGELRELLTSISSAAAGDHRWLVLMFHDITEVITANHSLVQTTEALTEATVELRAQAMLDPLTGLLNRRGFEELAPKTFAVNRHSGGFLMLDLDNFKETNDSHGHETGDAVLTAIADTIRSGTRHHSDIVARLGGDEFVVAMPGSSRSEVESVAERIRSGVAAKALVDTSPAITVTVTIGGVHRLPGTAIGLDVWREAADSFLYQAKAAGRNRVKVGLMNEATSSGNPTS